MSNSDTVEPISPYFAGGSRRAASFRTSTPSARPSLDVRPDTSPTSRPSKKQTARSRTKSPKKSGKKGRLMSSGPTQERIDKGDIAAPRTVGGYYRSLSMAERLRDRGDILQKPISRLSPTAVEQLHDRGKLDRDPRTNLGMFEAAEKLRRHFEGSQIDGVLKAQDLNKVTGGSAPDLNTDEAWVHHRQQLEIAKALMGWSDTNPHRGAARIVIAVVCQDQSIYDAAVTYTGLRDTTAIRAAGIDRLREGLFALAMHWKMV